MIALQRVGKPNALPTERTHTPVGACAVDRVGASLRGTPTGGGAYSPHAHHSSNPVQSIWIINAPHDGDGAQFAEKPHCGPPKTLQ